MDFDIFALVSAKRNTFAIDCQTVVVTSLRMASLDHHRLTGAPQLDTSRHWLEQRSLRRCGKKKKKHRKNTNFELAQTDSKHKPRTRLNGERVGRAHVYLWLQWEEHR